MDNATLNKRQERLYYFKIFAMAIPIFMAIIAVIVMVIITFQVFNTDMSLKVTYSLGITAGLSIIGIAFTAWVGLNIYTFIERSQMDVLDGKVEKMTKSIDDRMEELEKQLVLTIEFSNSINLSSVRQSKLMRIYDKLVMQNGKFDIEGLDAYKQAFEADKDRFLINNKLKIKYFLDHSVLMGTPMQLMQFVNSDSVPQDMIDVATDFIVDALDETRALYCDDMKDTSFSQDDLEQEKENLSNNLDNFTVMGIPWTAPPTGGDAIPPKEPVSEPWYKKVNDSVEEFRKVL